MDVKDLQSEATLGDRNNDGSKYSSNGVTLPYSRNKSYQDVNSVSLGKVDAPTARPCAVIGPDRVMPPPVSSDTIKKSAFEAWCADNDYRYPPENPLKITNYNTPIRNISPRQTFQENMQRIMVPPTYNSMKGNEEYNSHMDKNISMTKNTKPNIPIETKYCEVPYSGNPIINEQKSVRNNELSASHVNPVLARSAPQGWPSHLRQSKPYGAPELYQYPDYANCPGPRPVPMARSHRTAHEDLSHGYADLYCHDVRYKPYTVKDRYPQARYEYISNYPSPFHPPPAYAPHKYDMQKPIPQPYAYQQVPLKYLDNRIPDTVIDGYHRPTQPNNYNLPFHNQMIHPAYGPTIVGNCIQNKFPCPPPEGKAVAPNKQLYESNKMYTEYENSRPKTLPEHCYYNEMQRPPPHIKNQVMPNYSINMQRFPPHPYYTKDGLPLKGNEYMPHFRNVDPSVFTQSRIPSQFSPNGITVSPIAPNHNLENSQIQVNSQEDYGYISQSPTGNMRNTDFVINRATNEVYRRYDSRYGHPARPPSMLTKHDQNSNENTKDKKDINVRQFLQMWSEVDDENGDNASKESQNHMTTKQYETVNNQDQLYVLGLVNVPSEELSKYEHIQKVSKLPENIKGYNSIELLNQFEEVIESSNVNNFKSKPSAPKDITYQVPMKNSSSHISMLPRPVSPLDVEAKISQSVIHKEVGCNFEIKPCSPKMLNVEAATPIQNLLGERAIEKVSNPLIITPPLMHSEDKLNCNVLNHHEPRKSPNDNVKNTSCKMSNTQFNNNDIERPNYSLQDLESNSGICLASLPRLDNDIELNFPEVNQQFINANIGESVITTKKDLPSFNMEHIENINAIEQDANICQKSESSSELSSVIDPEREFSKLSKYRKIKKYGPEISTQNMRTDSVIIKNPENPKIYEENKDMETLVVCDKNIKNKEKVLESVDSEKELSNKLNNPVKYNYTDIAIDFSLNKNDNNNTILEYYIESEHKSDSSKINNSRKQLETSQSIELLNDQTIENPSRIMNSKDGKVLSDKRKDDMLKITCNSDTEEYKISHTVTIPEFSEFDMCQTTDDRSLEKFNKFNNNDGNKICEIKIKEGTAIAKYVEIKNKEENLDSTSVLLHVEDYVNESNNNTNSEIIEGSKDTQSDETRNLELPVLNIETTIPTSLHMCQREENEKKEELFSQKNVEEDTKIKTDQTDLSNFDGKNRTVKIQNDTDSITDIQQKKHNKTETCADANDNTENTFSNEMERISDELGINLCSNDKTFNNINEKESNEFSKEIENNMIGLFYHDENTIQTDIIQDKVDCNQNCGVEQFDSHTENKDSESSQTNITLQLVNDNCDSMLDSTGTETVKTRKLLEKDESLEDKPLDAKNDSEGSNPNKILTQDIKASDILPSDIPSPEPQPITSKLDDSQLSHENPSINSIDESNPVDSSRKNINPSVNTEYDGDSNQPQFSFKTSQTISNPINTDSNITSHSDLDMTKQEDNILNINSENDRLNKNILPDNFFQHDVANKIIMAKVTHIESQHNENQINFSNNELECEQNEPCTKRFLTCQLKKELFSPFIRKLISHNEGPVNSKVRECSSNVEINPSYHYANPDCVENGPAQIKLVDKDLDHSKSSSGKTCDNEDYTENESSSLSSTNIVKDNIDDSMIEKYNAVSECDKIYTSTDGFEERLSALESDIDLYNDNSKKCVSPINKRSNECMKDEDTFANSFTVVEHSENKEDLTSSDSVNIDNMDSKLETDNNDLREPDGNSEATELILSINEEIITNSDLNNEVTLNIETLQDFSNKTILKNNQYKEDSNRPRLKRCLSDSALDSFNDSNDTFYSGWRSKRPKNKICNFNIEPDLLLESNSQNNRRNSISSVYNEQNVSFCILIDNNCIITEENEEQGEICITELSEACLTDIQEPVNEYDNVSTPQRPDSYEECNPDYSETQEIEESWVDDVGCMETIVSDDVAEDITISASSSPERMHSPDNDESGVFMNSEHTDKVKHIYGAKMCNDDIMFLETLYRTPQMNVNKIINRESQVSEEYVQCYNKDSLENVLSEPSCHEEHFGLETLESLNTNSCNLLKDVENVVQDEYFSKDALPIGESSPVCDTDECESNKFQYNEHVLVAIDKTQDDTVHSCESSVDNVFSYSQKDDYRSYTSSTSPEVSSTTSEERNSSILLKITNYKGSRISEINDIEKETKSISCKFTELNDYSSSQNFKTNRPLITKAAQKYIPPLEETFSDLKIRLPLPQHSLIRLKQLKLLKNEPKSNKCSTKLKPEVPKKPRPKFEDVLKSIDEIQFKMHKEKSKKSKKTIPKVVIKKNENGSHYASTTNIKPLNPDLTGRKWQPWVFLEKNNFIDKMALRNKRKAIFNHRKNTYVLADKFRKYKSIGNAKFVISQPNLHSSSLGHLKCTIRLKHTY